MPDGGLTLVSPYDVYVKAQEKIIDGETKYAFNYEKADKTSSSDESDNYFQPTAVISNSRVYFLSSEFKDFNPDNGDEYPYPYNFPNNPYSVRENTFLQDYCWDNWPGELPQPGSEEEATWSWVEGNLDNDQQKTLLDAGESQWDSVNSDKMINQVTKSNYYNVAVASPEDPRGVLRERVDKYMTIEGAFIRLKDRWAENYRSHKSCEAYEINRFNLTSYTWRGDDFKVYGGGRKNYEYEERFWSPGGRPSGDFASGSQASWQMVSDFDYH